MNFFLLLSATIRVAALAWSIALLRRYRDWRMLVFCALIVLTTVRAGLDATEAGRGHGEWALTYALGLRAMTSISGTLLALAALHAVDTILTGHVDAREAIRLAGEQRYRRIVDTAQEGIWSIDEAGETNFVNQRMAQMLGYRADEMVGRHLLDFVSPASRDAARRYIDPEGRQEAELVEAELVAKDGSRVRARLATNRLFDRDERYDGALAMVTDITAEHREELLRRRTEEELERTQALLVAAIEQSHAGIIVADAPDGRVLFANGVALGVQAGAPLRLGDVQFHDLPVGWETFLPDGTHLRPEEQPLTQALHEGRRTHNMELLMRRNDGLKRWVLTNAAPVRNAAGEITAGIAVLLDITERKRDERDQRRLLKSLGEKTEGLEGLFRATSHDLRAPLVNIDGFGRELEVACEGLKELLSGCGLEASSDAAVTKLVNDEIPFALSHIRTSTRRMDELMTALSQLSRIDRTKLEVHELDMNEVVGQVLRGFDYRMRDRGVELVLEPLPACLADARQLEQVFANLIDNAIKYLDPARPGRVVISGRVEGDRCVYRIEDNGIGIEPEFHKKIFGAFRRLRPETVSGDGLGLTILRRILERLDGHARVVSSVGHGSRFEVELPAAHEPVETAAAR